MTATKHDGTTRPLVEPDGSGGHTPYTDLGASENHVGQVGGHTVTSMIQAVISAGAIYAAGDAIGAKLVFPTCARVTGGSGIVQSVLIIDRDKENAAMDLVLFNLDPAPSTITDNAALTLGDADLIKIAGVVPIAAADYCDFADNSVASIRNVGLPFHLDSGTSLYGALVSRGTPTYTAITDVTVILGILQD